MAVAHASCGGGSSSSAQAVAVARSGGGALLLSVRLLACMVCSVPGIRLRSESREEQRAGSS